jgi:uncharacterized membrane protein YccC
MADPTRLQRACVEGERTLLSLTTDAPSRRLLADETAKVLSGIACVFDGLTLLVDAPGQLPAGNRPARNRLAGNHNIPRSIPDWLPALVGGVRAFVAISAAELFWVATAWPSGALVIVFLAIAVLLLSPKGDLAYLGALAFAVATTGAIVAAGIIKFAVLPAFETFAGFCASIGLFLIPVGFAAARSATPALMTVFGALGVNFLPLLSATNPMIYDTAQYYNSALAIFVGCGLAPLVFRLLPPLSPALRVRRLLALTLRDLRRLVISPPSPRAADWEQRMYDRLAALPDQAEPLQRGQLLAALSVGTDINELRELVPQFGATNELGAALASLAQGNTTVAIARLHQLDRRVASVPNTGAETDDTLRMRGRIVAISEVLAEHSSYFDSGVSA